LSCDIASGCETFVQGGVEKLVTFACYIIAFFVGTSAAASFLSLSLSLSLTLSLQPAACISEYIGNLPCSQGEGPAVAHRHLKALRSALRNESQLLQPSQSVTLMEVLPCLSPSADFAPVSRCLPACTRDWDAPVQPSPSNYFGLNQLLISRFSSLLAQSLSLVSPVAVETAARYSGVPLRLA
jgi:hypothetical protein